MRDRLVWDHDGRDWPNRECSRFIEAAGLRWHVQYDGAGPAVMLLHGTGASTHSWRGVFPALARQFTVVAPDLPGHGFTSQPSSDRFSLPAMASALGSLLEVMEVRPAILVGHSAGAAIALRMCLDASVRPDGVVSINGALLPFRGLPGHLFSPAARLLARLNFVPRLVARRAADPQAVTRVLEGTGSDIDDEGVALYRRLMRSPAHVAATIAMMSQWDLSALATDLKRLRVPLELIVGERDGTVSPAEAERVRRIVAAASVKRLPVLGHLAHEERPEEFAALILDFARSRGVVDVAS